ncbi:hypothetical protein ACFFRR_006219 [Megaselia abdita]
MAFKFVVALAFVAVASAGLIPAAQVYHTAPVVAAAPLVHAAPVLKTVAQPVLAKQVEEYDPHPQYKFGYDVQDSLTGDSKSQSETRDGDVVQGEYSLTDADGFRRTVQYTADPVNGFNAVVHREPLVKSAVVAAPVVKTVAPVAYTAPVVKTIAAHPVAYTSAHPVAYTAAHPVAYSTPVVKTVSPVAYSAAHPVAYTAAHPVAYSAPVVKTVATAPVVAYHH